MGCVVNATHQPLYPRKGPIVQEGLCAPGPAWTDAKNLVPTEVLIPHSSLQVLLHGICITDLCFEIKHMKEKKTKRMFDTLSSFRGDTWMLSGFIWLRIRSSWRLLWKRQWRRDSKFSMRSWWIRVVKSSWTWCGVDWFPWTFRRSFSLYFYGTNSPIKSVSISQSTRHHIPVSLGCSPLRTFAI
jgi:hypothetical protein